MSHRLLYLDVLRIIAIIAVVMIHVSNKFLTEPMSDTTPFLWYVSCAYYSFSRWAVPVFCMISGALFLDGKQNIPIKMLYKKYIYRIFISFVFWSIVYAVYVNFGNDWHKLSTIKTFIGDVVHGHYHLWFLWMIGGLYISFPILKLIYNDKKILKYYLTIMLVYAFLIPFFFDLSHSVGFLENFMDKVWSGYAKMNLHLVLGYVGYFLIGGFLKNYDFSKMFRRVIYFGCVLSFIFIFLLTSILHENDVDYYNVNGTFLNYQGLLVFVMSIGVFVFTKNLSFISNLNSGWIEFLAKNVFGVYLIHIFVLDFFVDRNLLNYFTPIWGIPFLTIMIFLVSIGIVMCLRKILPYSKYLV